MAKYSSLFFLCMSFILASTLSLVCDAIDGNEKLHIVYMGSLPNGAYSPTSHHLTMLRQVTEGSAADASIRLVRSYQRSFNGFAAMITDQQREKLANMEGVVSVFPSKTLKLHTTRSWDFLGLRESANQQNRTAGSDVIVGVIDTGIWPESDSFNDQGFGPVPKKWKGACAGGKNFTCNNKIIGARYYPSSSDSARDNYGHGSHTASTAAGNKATSEGFYGIAGGIARGGFPSARIAAYAACQEYCSEPDILAAFDDSIADGVDLIIISLGNIVLYDFNTDVIAIGAFHAMEKGILTINSGGNSGPDKGSTDSAAPWMLSVAASTIDRRIIDKVSLGNGVTISGKGINSFTSKGKKTALVTGSLASYKDCPGYYVASCGCLDPKLVKGKIVCCNNNLYAYRYAYEAGAFGSILKPDSFESLVTSYPSLNVEPKAYDLVVSYANSTSSPLAEILKSEAIVDTNAPIVADFSSRGPNELIPEIMKPDICAPGVEILAAYSPIGSVSGSHQDKRSVKYNILSGTSVSCSHVAGIAAYVKSFHPDWSPAAIKSSIMTTAKPMKGSEDLKEFAYGSGHVDPLRAINPGLVFDLSKEDYVSLLCNIGYDTKTVRKISGDNSTCPSSAPQRSVLKDINYPSLAIQVQPMQPFSVNFTRTVTNVGFPNSTYKASVQTSSGVNVTVVPQALSFKTLKEKQSFIVYVVGGKFEEIVLSSSLLWTDGTHIVRCPIVVNVSQKV